MENRTLKTPFYRRFGWKLTVSYMVASVITAVLVVVAGTLITVLIFYQSPLWQQVVAQETLNLTPQIREEMHTPSAHAKEITTWLLNLKAGLEDRDHVRKTGFSFSLEKTGMDINLVVADKSGKIIAEAPEKLEGSSPEAVLHSETRRLFEAAIRGETRPEFLSTVDDDNTTTAVAPVIAGDGEILGVMITRIRRPFDSFLLIQNVSRNLLPQIVIVALFAAIFGAFFGFLTARRLTRRIHKFSVAADAWEKGSFAQNIVDIGKDELSQLATRLNHMASELKNLLKVKANLAALEERNRLAMDLHDTVKQQIFSANMQLSAAQEVFEDDSKAAQNYVSEAKKLIHGVQRELTLLINELRPVDRTSEEFTETVDNLIKDWQQQNDVNVRSEIEDLDETEAKTQHQIVCILQESLSNIARHSSANEVEIRLQKLDGGRGLLFVSDNGKGFDVSGERTGWGLQNIRERCESLREGSLEISSRAKEGTVLEISWRLEDG